ncbi:MAG: DUF4349 domain-containing protein [Steroidobacteraceae bacterium]
MKSESGTTRAILLPIVLMPAVLAGACSESANAPAPGLRMDAAPISNRPSTVQDYLAQEHHVTIDAAEDEIAKSFEAVIQACKRDRASDCTLLDSSLSSGDYPSAQLGFRLKPAGIEALVEVATGSGTITDRSSRSEDLAGPIVDVERKKAMLQDYLADLERLRQQSRSNIDSLIKVTGEIAKTESELEALSGEHARLRLRTDLDILRINYVSQGSRSFWTPIGIAFGDFSGNLSSGVAGAVTGFAHVLPWLLILVPIVWLFRRLWKRWK